MSQPTQSKGRPKQDPTYNQQNATYQGGDAQELSPEQNYRPQQQDQHARSAQSQGQASSGYKPFVDEDEIMKQTTNDVKPLSQRTRTDSVCMIIFLVLGLVFLCISAYGVYEGDPSKLGLPIDPDGNVCGQGLAKEYPFIYWVNPWKSENLYMTVCVKKCLTDTKTGDYVKNPLICLPNSVVPSCKFGNQDPDDPKSLMVAYYDTVALMGKVCVPTSTEYFKESSSAMFPPRVDSWASDLNNTSGVLVSSLLLTLVLGIFFIFLTSKVPNCMVWTFIVAYIVGLLALSVYSFIKSQPSELEKNADFHKEEDILNAAKNQNDSSGLYLAIAIISLIFCLISIILIVKFKSKIETTIKIIDTAGDFIIENMVVLVVPLLSFLCILIYFIYWVTVLVFFYGAGSRKELPVEQRFPFGQFEQSGFMQFMTVVHFFSMFYYIYFLITFAHYLICSAFTYWYFKTGQDTDNPDEEKRNQELRKKSGFVYNPFNAIRIAFASGIKYHFGSIALGAFVQLILGIPAWIAVIIRELRQSAQNQEKSVDKGCCQQTFYWITSNSFVIMAHNGSNYRAAGFYSSALVDKHYDTYSIASSFGSIFIFLGNVFITFIIMLISYLVINYTGDYIEKLNSPFFPIAIISAVSFITSTCFMGIFATSVEANLICYFIELTIDEKEARQQGRDFDITKSGQKLNPSMKKFIENSNQKKSLSQSQSQSQSESQRPRGNPSYNG